MSSNSVTSLPKIPLSQTPRSTQETALTFKRQNSLVYQSYFTSKEDNATRRDKVKEVLSSFQSQVLALQKSKQSMLDLKGRLREHTISLYGILEKVLSLYNINIDIVLNGQADSAIKVEPILHVGQSFETLMGIAVVLSRFPYSFIKAIELHKITVCENIYLKNEGFKSVYETRLMSNAIFTIERHNSYQKIEKHFYKIMLYHIEKKMPSLHEEWPTEKISYPKSVTFNCRKEFLRSTSLPYIKTSSLTSLSLSGKTITVPGKFGLETVRALSSDETKIKEKMETFYKMMKYPKEILVSYDYKLQTKANFVRKCLEDLDPIGIDEEWWKEIMGSDLKFIEEVMNSFF